jgi:hypothetical protein
MAFWQVFADLANTRELAELAPESGERLRQLSTKMAELLAACNAGAQEEILAKFVRIILTNLTVLGDEARQAIDRQSGDVQTGKTSGEDAGGNHLPPLGKGPEFPAAPIPPEIKEWARQHFNEEETAAGLREIQETGGLELADFIEELKQAATPHE